MFCNLGFLLFLSKQTFETSILAECTSLHMEIHLYTDALGFCEMHNVPAL